MTDMRSTERLLEVLKDAISEYAQWPPSDPASVLNDLGVIVDELRRRGDTLVRAADLRAITPFQDYYLGSPEECDAATQAWERIENALGGKIR